MNRLTAQTSASTVVTILVEVPKHKVAPNTIVIENKGKMKMVTSLLITMPW